ncbi:nodulation protein NfeD [Candidatus Bathyarchaeota archaeon]|nr:nodulation protein NfeD [Candidatus Bathyarchaeota archaeon]
MAEDINRENRVITVEINGTITVASVELVREAIEYAKLVNAELLLIILNTPGGQLEATMKIIELVESSKIPVASYVFPKGAKAWSAGVFILISSHIAAMAPHALIGSAQPISYSPFSGSEPIEDPKVIKALSKFIAEKAVMHKRNETAAWMFVEKNLNLNSEEAFRYRVIDVLASSIEELLDEVDGRPVETVGGQWVTLKTRGAKAIKYSASFKNIFLANISNPILAYLLFIIGLYALILGIATPGYGGEILGAIALILGLIGLGFNVSFASIMLIGLGLALIIAEVYSPGFGVLGIAGIFCLAVGSLLIIPFEAPKWLISSEWYLHFIIIAVSIITVIAGFAFFVMYKILKARARKPLVFDIIGERVEVVEEVLPKKVGFVKYKGEYWKAKSDENLKPGTIAIVVGKEGPTLVIKSKFNE